jgi:hypothetical protein
MEGSTSENGSSKRREIIQLNQDLAMRKGDLPSVPRAFIIVPECSKEKTSYATYEVFLC